MEVDIPELPLSDLQKRADEILSGIRDVDENIKKVTGRDFSEIRRGFNQRMSRRRIARERLPRIDTDIPPEVAKEGQEIQLDSVSNQAHVMSEVVQSGELVIPPVEEKVEEMDEETSSRSKRMFGHLIGTLKKFKQENEHLKEQAVKRQEIEKKLEDRATKEHQEIIQQRRELFQTRREKERDLRTLRRQIWIKELEERAKTHFDSTGMYILSSSSTPIFYLPAKHTDETMKKLEKTRELLNTRRDEFIRQIPEFTAFIPDFDKKDSDKKDEDGNLSTSNSSSNDEEESEPNKLERKASPVGSDAGDS